MLSALSRWLTTLLLVFGGCCSNAITLEQITSHYPQSGTLLTFIQFLLISLHGLPSHIEWTRAGPRLKARRIPLAPYIAQVVLFYLVSLLNNAAFAYRIPLAVHIIFRSGGLIVSMILGWLISGKTYSLIQIASVLAVTLGVILTTLSSQPTARRLSPIPDAHSGLYAKGIMILTIALLLSGFLGLTQDWTYSTYGRPTAYQSPNGKSPSSKGTTEASSPTWKESMFYLHVLALPMFIPLFPNIVGQLEAINAGQRTSISIALPAIFPQSEHKYSLSGPSRYLPITLSMSNIEAIRTVTLSFPAAYLPLLLNTLTQVLCVAGVHRLTTRVSTLSVTLILAVRKALSFLISVLGVNIFDRLGLANTSGANRHVDMKKIWTGGGLVLLGTIGYSFGTMKKGLQNKNKARID